MNHYRMIFYFSVLMLSAPLNAVAQDTIVKRSNEIILCKVVEVGDTEISFHRQNNLNGPIYIIEIADVSVIKYASGAKDIFNTADIIPNQTHNQPFKEAVKQTPPPKTEPPVQQTIEEPVEEPKQEETVQTEQAEIQETTPQMQNPYLQGQIDSKKYYRKHKAAGITTLISTCLAPFEFGLAGGAVKAVAVAVVLSIKTPPTRKLGVPNKKYLSNSEYMAGYRNGALKKKRRKIWLNFMYPAAVYLTLFAAGVIQ